MKQRTLIQFCFMILLLVTNVTWAQTRNFGLPRYTTNTNGSIAIAANTLMECSESGSNGASCANARNGTGSRTANNNFTMIYVDEDGDASTFNSSRAFLDIPDTAEILFAGLYWGARSGTGRNQMKLRLPGSSTYEVIPADQVDSTGNEANSAYASFANVTQVLKNKNVGRGDYWGADVRGRPNNDDQYAAWSLVVAYSDSSEELRNVAVFDGFEVLANQNGFKTTSFNLSGFTTPLNGPVYTDLGAIAYEGDLQYGTGDYMRLENVELINDRNPSNNFFNSTISSGDSYVTNKNPNYVNQFGFDADLFGLEGPDALRVSGGRTVGGLGHGQESANITVGTGLNGQGETFYLHAFTFATDIQPVLEVTKTGSDVNGGELSPDDIIEYTLTVTDQNFDTAQDIALTDVIPDNTSYVADSLQILSGPNSGTKTDNDDGDQAEYDATNDQVVFRLGTGANGSQGGELAANEVTVVKFRVKVDSGVPNRAEIYNVANLTYESASTSIEFDAVSPDVLNTVQYADYGDAPASYGAASHITSANPTLYVGTTAPDDEQTSQNSANGGSDGTGDDLDVDGDDEEGVLFPTLIAGQSATIQVDVTQASANNGYLQGWIDWNSDGDFDDADEQIATNLQSPLAGTSQINVPVIPIVTPANRTFARFRWSTAQNLDAEAPAPDGEVEDYTLTFATSDYGDAPASYGEAEVTAGNQVYLGSTAPDAETSNWHDGTDDSQNATDDDTNDTPANFTASGGEEDSVVFGPLDYTMAGQSFSQEVSVTNDSAAPAYVKAWIDFDRDGTFDADEVSSEVTVAANAGTTTANVTFNIPANSAANTYDGVNPGPSFARVIVSDESGIPLTGRGAGEVEDLRVNIADVDFCNFSPGETFSGFDFTNVTGLTNNASGQRSAVAIFRNAAVAPDGTPIDVRATVDMPRQDGQRQGVISNFGNGTLSNNLEDTGLYLSITGNPGEDRVAEVKLEFFKANTTTLYPVSGQYATGDIDRKSNRIEALLLEIASFDGFALGSDTTIRVPYVAGAYTVFEGTGDRDNQPDSFVAYTFSDKTSVDLIVRSTQTTTDGTAGFGFNGRLASQEVVAPKCNPIPPPTADLSLTKTVDDSTPAEGESVTFTLTLKNDGPDQATGVEVTDLLPAGLTLSSTTPPAASQGSYTPSSGVWNVGTLANGANATLAVTATVDEPAAAQITNTAEVTAADQVDQDSFPDNRSAEPGEDDTASVTLNIYRLSPPDTAGGIVINEVLFDQSGSTSAAENDEFIELYNAGTTTVDLTGWQLVDANLIADDADGRNGNINGNSNNTAIPYTFPARTLAPGEYAIIWVGERAVNKDAPSAAFQTWLGKNPRLSNSGDDVWLYDAQKRIVDYIAYGTNTGGKTPINTPPPASLNLWDAAHNSTLDNTDKGQSISLTPNGVDSNTSACWEPTTSGEADGRCTGYLSTTDSDAREISGTQLVTSLAQNNNASEKVVTGTLFYDDGLSGGTANNAEQESGEQGVSGVVVTATDGTNTVTATTNGAGGYSLVIPDSFGDDITLSHSQQPATGYNDGSSPARQADSYGDPEASKVQFTFAGSATYNFGVVRPSALRPDQSGQVGPGSAISYTHLYAPGTLGEVALSVSGTYTYQAFRDADCDGIIQVDEQVDVLTSGFTVDSGWPRAEDGSLAPCALELRVFVPQGEPSGRIDLATLSASLVYDNNSNDVTDTQTVTDITTVSAGGQLELSKRVANVSRGTAFKTVGEGKPGEVLEYCITYQNLGTQPLTQTLFSDPVPFFTAFEEDAYTDSSGATQDIKWVRGATPLYLSAAADSDVGELSGGVVKVSIGEVAAGETGEVCYRVRIK